MVSFNTEGQELTSLLFLNTNKWFDFDSDFLTKLIIYYVIRLVWKQLNKYVANHEYPPLKPMTPFWILLYIKKDTYRELTMDRIETGFAIFA